MKQRNSFEDLGLSQQTLEAINKKGFEEPSPIQKLTIPVILQKTTDIIAQAQTGTGKTAAFALPLIEQLKADSKNVQALILAPTRELAIQVAEEINSLQGDKKLKVVPVYGGQSIGQQLRRLEKGADIVVGTPGRIIDHLNRKTLKLNQIKVLVLDEADEMLNMGFIDDMEEIFKYTNPEKRTLLFSATIPQKINSLSKKYMKEFDHLQIKKDQLTTNLTSQIYFEVKASDKFETLCRLIDIEDSFYGIIFCRTKRDTDALAKNLCKRGYDAAPIHGDISQNQRERTLKQFKDKKTNILIATDVAARGIDVNNISHVINYSLPQDPEAYVHRIGRTGRAGNEGTAITFITPSEYKKLMFIQRIAKADIKKSKVPSADDIIKIKKKKIDEDIEALVDEKIEKTYYNWAKSLLEKHKPTEILASVLKYSFEDEIDKKQYNDIKESPNKAEILDKEGQTRLFIALGKKDKATVKNLISLITDNVSIKAKQIQDIQIMDKYSFITVPFNKAEKIIKSFQKKGRGKRNLITHANKK